MGKKSLHLATKDVFVGGPLASNAMFVIHSSEYFIDKKTIKVCEEISVTGSKEITDDIQKGEGPKKVLFLLGYSGWAPGQLEDEIMRDSWFVSEKIENLVFDVDYQSKWSDALLLIGMILLIVVIRWLLLRHAIFLQLAATYHLSPLQPH